MARANTVPGEGGLMPSSACSSGCSGDEAELRCRGDRLVHSSRPLEAAAVAELHVALAFRGCCGEGKSSEDQHFPSPFCAPASSTHSLPQILTMIQLQCVAPSFPSQWTTGHLTGYRLKILNPTLSHPSSQLTRNSIHSPSKEILNLIPSDHLHCQHFHQSPGLLAVASSLLTPCLPLSRFQFCTQQSGGSCYVLT